MTKELLNKIMSKILPDIQKDILTKLKGKADSDGKISLSDITKILDNNDTVFNDKSNDSSDWKKYVSGNDTVNVLGVPTTKSVVTDIIAPVASGALDTTGKALNVYNSILGNALQAMSQREAARESNPNNKSGLTPSSYSNMAGAGKIAKGGVLNTVLSGAAKTIDKLTNNVKNSEEIARNRAMLINNAPSGAFFNAQIQQQKLNNEYYDN